MRIKDLVIVLPGITGSVLQKDGKDVWAASGQALWRGFSSGFDSLRDLSMQGVDDPGDDFDDGVRATRLIDDIHIVPGFHKVDGYSDLRRLLTRKFTTSHDPSKDEVLNYFEFPYDWRRDNRVSAKLLKRFIDERLHAWRKHSANSDAKVILVAHSMGGLISRYYLEVLGGWQDSKLLITFGTPYRGSLDMIENLSSGMKRFGINIKLLGDIMKTLPSVYQLLPRYPSIKVGGEWKRVTETDVVPNLTPAVAAKGIRFMHEIDEARERNAKDARYHTHGYKIIPVVGTGQKTWQSAFVKNGELTMSRNAPAGLDPAWATGDGTVPRVSAVPIELSNAFRESFHAEKHGSLQSNRELLGRLTSTLITSQGDASTIKGGEMVEEPKEAWLSLDVEDVYSAENPVQISAELISGRPGGDIIVSLLGADEAKSIRASASDGEARIDLGHLPKGVYEITLSVSDGQTTSVNDVFAVG